jgi:phage repressor protein C with HTH and peptisase S24 domain
MKAIDRIYQYLEYNNIKRTPFERKIGVSVGYLAKQKLRKADLGEGNINKILDYCPDLNPTWLLTGKGVMLLKNVNHSNLPNSLVPENECIKIPIYNAEALSGKGQLQLKNEYVINNLQVPFARQGDIALTIIGYSMSPKIENGDIAVVRNMPNWKEYLDFGNIFVVVTEEEVYCKKIQKNNNIEAFTLQTYNTNCADFDIPQKYIKEVYKVIGVISQRCH